MTFRSLICEEHDVDGKLQPFVSIGRVSFWILLSLMTYFWLREIAVPESLYNSWVAVLIYNLSKKLVTLASERISVTIK